MTMGRTIMGRGYAQCGAVRLTYKSRRIRIMREPKTDAERRQDAQDKASLMACL